MNRGRLLVHNGTVWHGTVRLTVIRPITIVYQCHSGAQMHIVNQFYTVQKFSRVLSLQIHAAPKLLMGTGQFVFNTFLFMLLGDI
jgi:hypothetical protein